ARACLDSVDRSVDVEPPRDAGLGDGDAAAGPSARASDAPAAGAPDEPSDDHVRAAAGRRQHDRLACVEAARQAPRRALYRRRHVQREAVPDGLDRAPIEPSTLWAVGPAHTLARV